MIGRSRPRGELVDGYEPGSRAERTGTVGGLHCQRGARGHHSDPASSDLDRTGKAGRTLHETGDPIEEESCLPCVDCVCITARALWRVG
jgi:hypothetical protein